MTDRMVFVAVSCLSAGSVAAHAAAWSIDGIWRATDYAQILAPPRSREPLDDYDMISLPTPDGRRETRAKRANQKSEECPQQ